MHPRINGWCSATANLSRLPIIVWLQWAIEYGWHQRRNCAHGEEAWCIKTSHAPKRLILPNKLVFRFSTVKM